jgi:hypothetical protein
MAWLKYKALSSNPSTTKRKEKKKKNKKCYWVRRPAQSLTIKVKINQCFHATD